ncbi:hypothetical protein CAPTEDRAFT_143699, partial [Capitella teleta]
KSHIAVASGGKCGFEILSRLLYTPDLTTSDYKPFGNLKNIRGRHFASNRYMGC